MAGAMTIFAIQTYPASGQWGPVAAELGALGEALSREAGDFSDGGLLECFCVEMAGVQKQFDVLKHCVAGKFAHSSTRG